MRVFGQFLSRVHVRLVAKSTAPFQTGGRGDGGEAKEGQLEDKRNPKAKRKVSDSQPNLSLKKFFFLTICTIILNLKLT